MKLIDISPKDSLAEFLNLYSVTNSIDINKAHIIIKESIAYLRNGSEMPEYQKKLQHEWYSDLERGIKNYSVYSDKYYFTELWACWIVYSRNYLRSISRLQIQDITSVLDLGCGIGYSTIALKQMFKNASIYCTELDNTSHYQFCQAMSKLHDFKILTIDDSLKSVDFVFASEYFEHIDNPIAHLSWVLKTFKPKHLCIASAFNARAAGHFKHPSNMSREFNKALKNAGYQKVITNFWNDRPTLWEKGGEKHG